ncbi:hypothetical protein LZ012_12735 [Dechloromonas sp. XY25]|uniref:Outer membrane protein beta-barrel domain-containing protein n=1 Tax=Dechloromonas hankyongensis TaxID=2908002 RepID=A0ABS9K3X7_9RHOO|nr:hypothetical protein [Dechloromonas hankyongensis]MCG2577856.1 hypothetical protein [Dechloromonas hankyongensis]
MLSKSIFLLLSLLPALALADASRPGTAEGVDAASEAWSFKLTPSYYATTHQPAASDINLRANNGPHALWLGYYRRDSEFEQTRTGYEFTFETDYAKLVPSLQLATHGFAGAAVNLEIGTTVYALLGYGRTNARDYYNLNFDPNDSVVYGVGARLIPGTNLSLYTVKDNRLHTEQVVNHLVARTQLAEKQRLTLDLSEKHGRESADDPKVSGHGLSVTYDYRDAFLRLARDHKVNFSTENQSRLSLGLRF